jgi:hypothetical protein
VQPRDDIDDLIDHDLGLEHLVDLRLEHLVDDFVELDVFHLLDRHRDVSHGAV